MRTIKVQGKGRVSAEPDLVTLSFEVESKSRDYAECLRKLNEHTGELRSGLDASGIERANLKTTDFRVRVETQYADGRRTFDGYSASHNLKVEFPVDKELMNRVLGQVARENSGAEIRIAFSVTDRESLQSRILEEAVRVAKVNATTIARASGVTLGELQQIEYGWTEVQISHPEFLMNARSTPASGTYDADIEPEDVTAEDTVTLVYEIRG